MVMKCRILVGCPTGVAILCGFQGASKSGLQIWDFRKVLKINTCIWQRFRSASDAIKCRTNLVQKFGYVKVSGIHKGSTSNCSNHGELHGLCTQRRKCKKNQVQQTQLAPLELS